MGGKPEQCPQKGGGGGNEEKALSCFMGGFLVQCLQRALGYIGVCVC